MRARPASFRPAGRSSCRRQLALALDAFLPGAGWEEGVGRARLVWSGVGARGGAPLLSWRGRVERARARGGAGGGGRPRPRSSTHHLGSGGSVPPFSSPKLVTSHGKGTQAPRCKQPKGAVQVVASPIAEQTRPPAQKVRRRRRHRRRRLRAPRAVRAQRRRRRAAAAPAAAGEVRLKKGPGGGGVPPLVSRPGRRGCALCGGANTSPFPPPRPPRAHHPLTNSTPRPPRRGGPLNPKPGPAAPI